MYYHYKLKLNKKEEKIIGRYFKFFPRVLLGPGDDKYLTHWIRILSTSSCDKLRISFENIIALSALGSADEARSSCLVVDTVGKL